MNLNDKTLPGIAWSNTIARGKKDSQKTNAKTNISPLLAAKIRAVQEKNKLNKQPDQSSTPPSTRLAGKVETARPTSASAPSCDAGVQVSIDVCQGGDAVVKVVTPAAAPERGKVKKRDGGNVRKRRANSASPPPEASAHNPSTHTAARTVMDCCRAESAGEEQENSRAASDGGANNEAAEETLFASSCIVPQPQELHKRKKGKQQVRKDAIASAATEEKEEKFDTRASAEPRNRVEAKTDFSVEMNAAKMFSGPAEVATSALIEEAVSKTAAECAVESGADDVGQVHGNSALSLEQGGNQASDGDYSDHADSLGGDGAWRVWQREDLTSEANIIYNQLSRQHSFPDLPSLSVPYFNSATGEDPLASLSIGNTLSGLNSVEWPYTGTDPALLCQESVAVPVEDTSTHSPASPHAPSTQPEQLVLPIPVVHSRAQAHETPSATAALPRLQLPIPTLSKPQDANAQLPNFAAQPQTVSHTAPQYGYPQGTPAQSAQPPAGVQNATAPVIQSVAVAPPSSLQAQPQRTAPAHSLPSRAAPFYPQTLHHHQSSTGQQRILQLPPLPPPCHKPTQQARGRCRFCSDRNFCVLIAKMFSATLVSSRSHTAMCFNARNSCLTDTRCSVDTAGQRQLPILSPMPTTCILQCKISCRMLATPLLEHTRPAYMLPIFPHPLVFLAKPLSTASWRRR